MTKAYLNWRVCPDLWILAWLTSLVSALVLVGGALAAANPESQGGYRLGPNDLIRIQVFGEDDLAVESKVAGDGAINFPLLGSVHVAGKTVGELQDYLSTQLAGGYVRSPRVTVFVVRYRNFYVSGEVKTPGGYSYEAGLTVQKAISMAGGFTEKAETRKIAVTRVTEDRIDTLLLGPAAPVYPDDILAVSHMQNFYVTGEVVRPGRYPYDEQLTLKKTLTLAGGMTEKADPQGVKVTRLTEASGQTLTIGADALVLPDDIIVVEAQNHRIYVSGEVKTPGGFPYREGLSVQKVIAMAGGLTEKAEKDNFRITRRVNGREEILSANLEMIIVAEDVIVAVEGQKVYVSGEVRTPGRYLYQPGMTVQRVLTLAGGLTEKAEGGNIKITRLKETGVQTLLAKPETTLLSDDIVSVEAQNHRIYVSGEVKTPGGFPYREGLSVQKVIAMAGGASEKADEKGMNVIRIVNGHEESVTATLDTSVLPEDTIIVPERKKFYISGEVKTPGRYFYELGVTIQKALTMAGGFTEKADKAGVKVTRLNGTIVETILLEADTVVMPDDLIVVAQAKKFYVNGEVKQSGAFPFEKGLTVHKAITMAGGFTDKAAKNSAKVLRIIDGEERKIEIRLDAPVLPEDIIVVPQRFF